MILFLQFFDKEMDATGSVKLDACRDSAPMAESRLQKQ